MIIALLLLSLSVCSFAKERIEISCFSDGKRIYHGYGRSVEYNDDYFTFTENKSNHQILVFGECMFKV